MKTFVATVHFSQDINDPVQVDILSPDGTERVKESREINWSDGLEKALLRVVWDRFNDVTRPHGTREKYATNNDRGMNLAVFEILYED